MSRIRYENGVRFEGRIMLGELLLSGTRVGISSPHIILFSLPIHHSVVVLLLFFSLYFCFNLFTVKDWVNFFWKRQ